MNIRTARAAGVLAALLAPSSAAAVTPVTAAPPSATPVTINDAPGHQTDPHVSENWVSYTADVYDGVAQRTQIRYFDLATGEDRGIPNLLGDGTATRDSLSDVSGSTIAFSRVTIGKQAAWAFDAATAGPSLELDPQADSRRLGLAIGGPTIAWVDRAAGAPGEIVVYDRTTAATQTLTADGFVDRRPNVSPDGSVVVWEHCPTATTACDIWKAVRNEGSWSVGAVTDTPEDESDPDTNGSVVVYAREGPDPDVHSTSLATGVETPLELPDVQAAPAVSRDLVVFASGPSGQAHDVHAYDLATNQLYRLTNTPGASETLPDVWVSSDGRVHAIWSMVEADENVYGLTFDLPAPTFAFAGFFQPVDNLPTLNLLSPGQGVPVKFSLGGDRGLDVLADGFPRSEQIGCDAAAAVDGIEATSSAGEGGLTYDAVSDTYTYVWKTGRGWSGTCRQLVVRFRDGSAQRANFKFRR